MRLPRGETAGSSTAKDRAQAAWFLLLVAALSVAFWIAGPLLGSLAPLVGANLPVSALQAVCPAIAAVIIAVAVSPRYWALSGLRAAITGDVEATLRAVSVLAVALGALAARRMTTRAGPAPACCSRPGPIPRRSPTPSCDGASDRVGCSPSAGSTGRGAVEMYEAHRRGVPVVVVSQVADNWTIFLTHKSKKVDA
jgi:hypothetical protein